MALFSRRLATDRRPHLAIFRCVSPYRLSLDGLAAALLSTLTNIISVRYDPHGSVNHERAAVQDLVDKLRQAALKGRVLARMQSASMSASEEAARPGSAAATPAMASTTTALQPAPAPASLSLAPEV